MNNDDIEKMLIDSKSNFIPEIFDKIKNVEIEPIQQKATFKKKEKSFLNKFYFRFAYVAMSIILFFGVFYTVNYNKEYERVYLELNPSVEFVVNKYDKVLSVNYLNEDAENLYIDEKVKGIDLSKAIYLFRMLWIKVIYYMKKIILCFHFIRIMQMPKIDCKF